VVALYGRENGARASALKILRLLSFNSVRSALIFALKTKTPRFAEQSHCAKADSRALLLSVEARNLCRFERDKERPLSERGDNGE
jgi:hypothetical protein